MQVVISSRHGNLSKGTQRFIEEKAEKLLRYFERLTSIEVTVDLQNPKPIVEMLVSAEHKHDFVARETGASVHAAVDTVLHKMEQQLKRYKQKVQGHRNRSSSASREFLEEGRAGQAEPEGEG